MRPELSMKAWMVAKRWGPRVVVAVTMALIVLSVVGSEAAYAGLRWSGMD